ncbi:hypothetical protein IW262DRAFT_1529216 [Armillaria fumosa]|nr:hypothetical protein IW262DRAFT_1529216 [Armillaria fumosa]
MDANGDYHALIGTTGFPSGPISLTHEFLLQLMKTPYYGEVDLCGEVFSAQAQPYTLGFWITSFSTSIVTTSSVIKMNCTYVFTVPSFLEELVQDPAAVEALKATTDVNLYRPKLSRQSDIILVPTEEKDICGLYVKKSTTDTPAAFNAEIDGIEALDMKDLVQLHPSNPRLWKVYGRADEQITHSTGEKTNPEPIEAALMSDRHITSAVMFGQGKFQSGVLVQPSPEYAFDPKDTRRLSEYQIDKIYNVVDAVYSPAPDTTFLQNSILGSVIDIARDIVKGTFEENVGDNDDIFILGGDTSLTATLIRNSIIRVLRTVAPVDIIRSLPSSFVFDKPTITKL